LRLDTVVACCSSFFAFFFFSFFFPFFLFIIRSSFQNSNFGFSVYSKGRGVTIRGMKR
jgi:hypothetical protein